MVSYSVEKEHHSDGEIGDYISYGIIASENGKTLAEVNDVFTDHSEAECFASLITSSGLSLIHLEQVVEEFLLYN